MAAFSFWAQRLVRGLDIDQKSWKRENSYADAYRRWTKYIGDVEIISRTDGDEPRYGPHEILTPPSV
jgi:hypothetical protein